MSEKNENEAILNKLETLEDKLNNLHSTIQEALGVNIVKVLESHQRSINILSKNKEDKK